ncbi:MAG: transporter [Fimbriimonadaceae bacterium]|nr:transporter [Fimbriimonadaceae bacterium]
MVDTLLCLIMSPWPWLPWVAQQEPIVTDKPDFTESSVVVPVGMVQIESGSTWEDKTWRFPEGLLRYGVGPQFELRLGLPNYTWSEDTKGFGDLYIGVKVQGQTRDGTQFALIPAVTWPIGQLGVRSEVASPELKFVWSRGLSGGLSLSGMVFVLSTEEDGERRTPLQHTISLGIPLRDRLGMFVEHVLQLERRNSPMQLLHSGFAYQPNPNTQFDLHYGFGLTPNAPDFFIGVGYSVRF